MVDEDAGRWSANEVIRAWIHVPEGEFEIDDDAGLVVASADSLHVEVLEIAPVKLIWLPERILERTKTFAERV